ncbi:unnamed protein product [Kuraishia capsulata CBS 1993]|uniref:(S)-ureidoglycine aminohydrolase cupin domain-containing protein n=1 Tax=Kuraishia capsulata CBS 1993 TaxID=1382522 RepID=W6MQY5_9ASCO|nr:uncharacterized protein KUCA_T00005131001 [Kuraishia capsulata CBS 1993]CDK29144.1 unnamed protein product [Kuraishia capsulata CBS 1993]
MPMTYKPAAEGKEVLPPAVASASFLGDTFTSEAEPDKQISCGFFKQVDGEPLVYTYNYDEMKVILEVVGEYTITDEEGYTVKAHPGDVFYFKKGCTITFNTIGGYGLAWFCGLRQNGVL